MAIDLCVLGIGDSFLDRIPKAQVTKEIGKLDFIKIKNFFPSSVSSSFKNCDIIDI